MTATTFNPLAVARDLKAAGIEANHAEAIAEGMREAADAAAGADRGDLATKADLAGVRDELRAEIAGVRAEIAGVRDELRAEIAGVRDELRAEIAELRTANRADLETLRSELRWILGFLAALIFAMAAKLFGIV